MSRVLVFGGSGFVGTSAIGGTIYCMNKTTMYLPDDLKQALSVAAERLGLSEAEVIRRALREAVLPERPQPHGGLFASSEPFAEHVDELLEGFGQR